MQSTASIPPTFNSHWLETIVLKLQYLQLEDIREEKRVVDDIGQLRLILSMLPNS